MTQTIRGKQNTTLDFSVGPNPAAVGDEVVLTVVLLPMSNRQTGSVTFFDGATALGTSPLSDYSLCDGASGPNCIIKFTNLRTSTLSEGIHILTAQYAGDANFTAATSAPVTETITGAPVVALDPISLTVHSGNQSMQVSWNVTNDPTVVSYRIRRNAGENSRFATIAESWLDTTYFDTNNEQTNKLRPGITYCYLVDARRSDGSIAVTSNTVCAVFGSLDIYVPDTLGRPGESVIVPVNIRNADGLRITSSDIWMEFNSDIIESVGISRTGLTANYAWDFSVQDTDALPTKRLIISYFNLQPDTLHGNGSLFWLTFKVKGQPGNTSPLNLKEFISQIGGSSIQDLSRPQQDVPLTLTDGVFTVGAADAPCLLGDVDCDGVIRAADAALALRLAIGERSASAKELHAGDINGNNDLDSADASMILYFAAHRAWPVPQGVTSADASSLQASSVVKLNSAQAQPGKIVTITLSADNLDKIAGGDFAITYDPHVVKAVKKVTQTGLASSFQALAFHDSGKGLLTIALSHKDGVSGSGNLISIELELQSNAPVGDSPLTLASASLNDINGRDFVTSFDTNQLTRESGKVTVSAVAANKAVYLPLVRR